MIYYNNELNIKLLEVCNMMNNDYMQGIYDLLNEEEVVEYNDQGIEFLDDPIEDSMFYNDELSWADDIVFLDDPVEDEINLDLGEGFIPIAQGVEYQEEKIVIDENYVLDEFEEDLIEGCVKPSIEVDENNIEYTIDDIMGLVDDVEEEDTLAIDVESAKSIIKYPEVKDEVQESLDNSGVDNETAELGLAIAKEHMDNVKSGCTGLADETKNPEEDTSWVADDKDIFGADISVIIAEDPNAEVEETDFVEGSFDDWFKEQQKN
jgi:hypothetical protein